MSQVPFRSPSAIQTSFCSPEKLPYPSVYGAEILSLEATLIANYSHDAYKGNLPNHEPVSAVSVDFCNVTISLTHPGQRDVVHTQVWLPITNWNSRMQGIGGGGWQAGMFPYSEIGMAGAIGEGYASVTTNAGHFSASARDWALTGPGNVDLYALQNLASVSLNDAAIIGKDIIMSFYGKGPEYSYFSGCSQGGRQGLMLAQRYPTAYNGIASSAPAIHWPKFLVSDYWPQLIMNQFGHYPRPCELDALTSLAIKACDANDGVLDGIIADPDTCNFDPFTAVGTSFTCTDKGLEMQVSEAAAVAADASWSGPHSRSGSRLWWGVSQGASLTASTSVAQTRCDGNECIGLPLGLSTEWMQLFVLKNITTGFANMTKEKFQNIFHASVQEFSGLVGTSDPDLEEFRSVGGKLLGFHGLDDEIIPPQGSQQYYNRVTALHPEVHSFYRLFQVPGLGHCSKGRGAHPSSLFANLVRWVENGTAPDTLVAAGPTDGSGDEFEALLCPYPQKAWYNGRGNWRRSDSYHCVT